MIQFIFVIIKYLFILHTFHSFCIKFRKKSFQIYLKQKKNMECNKYLTQSIFRCVAFGQSNMFNHWIQSYFKFITIRIVFFHSFPIAANHFLINIKMKHKYSFYTLSESTLFSKYDASHCG